MRRTAIPGIMAIPIIAGGDTAGSSRRRLTSPHDAVPGPTEGQLTIGYTILHGIRPRDELEGMLAVQMVGIHNLMMLTMRRVAHSQLTERTNEYVNQMSKLARAFSAQVECINRYRGKGQQKMTVEHVHVNKGGRGGSF